MRGAKTCPECGFLLRHEDPRDRSFDARRFVGVEILLWVAVALLLAWLWAPSGMGELYGVLAFVALAAWFRLRPRQHAQGAALLERRQYACAQCGRRYTGADLDR